MKRRGFVGGLAGLAAASAWQRSFGSTEAFGGEGPITIGMSGPYTGPNAVLGQEVKAGADACVHAVNRAGGVHGRKIQLLALDDGYEPDRTYANAQRLLAQGAFCFSGFVGTPTTLKVLPIVSSQGIPLVGAFTGAPGLRSPMNRYVFNVRAGYDDEAPAIVKQLTSFSDRARIGLFIQSDAYGAAVQSGIERALVDRGLQAPVAVATVPRNATGAQLDAAIKSAVSQMTAARVDGIAMGSVYGACTRLVEGLRAQGSSPQTAAVSFVGTSYLLDYPGTAVLGMGISQVMPAPMYPTLKLTQDYLRAMAELGQSKPSYGSIEGYVSLRTVVAGLHRAGPNPTREKFVSSLEWQLDLGDFSLAFSKTNRNGSKFVDMVTIAEAADGTGKRIVR